MLSLRRLIIFRWLPLPCFVADYDMLSPLIIAFISHYAAFFISLMPFRAPLLITPYTPYAITLADFRRDYFMIIYAPLRRR